MSYLRINKYRAMWLLVFFDLPTETKKDRRVASQFRKSLQKDGFIMFQFSIYLRFCPSRENAIVHVNRIKKNLPQYGHVGILSITDKQFGMMEIFYGQQKKEPEKQSLQLELF